MEGLAVLAGIRGLVFGRHFNWLQLARERQDEEQRDCTADEPQAAGNLECHAEQKKEFNGGLTVELACSLHEGDVRRDASQGRKVVCDMKTGKRGDENGRCSVKGAEIHLKTANV